MRSRVPKGDYDVVVIGGGAGGIGAARASARRKARTLLVQHGPIGGDCTCTGCVPSKALIEAAARGASFAEAMQAAHRAIERIAATEHDEVFRREGIDVLHGWATLRTPRSVDVDGQLVATKRIKSLCLTGRSMCRRGRLRVGIPGC